MVCSQQLGLKLLCFVIEIKRFEESDDNRRIKEKIEFFWNNRLISKIVLCVQQFIQMKFLIRDRHFRKVIGWNLHKDHGINFKRQTSHKRWALSGILNQSLLFIFW